MLLINGALWLPFILSIDRRMCRQESTDRAAKILSKITAATKAKRISNDAMVEKAQTKVNKAEEKVEKAKEKVDKAKEKVEEVKHGAPKAKK